MWSSLRFIIIDVAVLRRHLEKNTRKGRKDSLEPADPEPDPKPNPECGPEADPDADPKETMGNFNHHNRYDR